MLTTPGTTKVLVTKGPPGELFTVIPVPAVVLFGVEVLSPSSVSPISPEEVDGNNSLLSWVHFFPVGAECDKPDLEHA